MTAKNSYAVQQLCQKMKNPDADLRFMALNDLISDIQRSGDAFGVDEATEHTTVEQVLQLLNDTNGEVKNQAVKALAALVKHVSEARIQIIIDRLVGLTASKDEGVRDIASLGLKTVVAEIIPESPLASTVCLKLAPKVIAQIESSSSSTELLIDALELLADIVSRFETTVKSMGSLQTSVLKAVSPLLDHDRAVVRKRSITTTASLIASSDVSLFDSLITSTVTKSLKSTTVEKVKTAVALVAALAKVAPAKMSKKAAQLVPLILKASSKEDDELREGALQALESLVLKCPTEVAPSILEIVELGTQYVKYDPNYAGGDDDEDVEMEDAEDDGDDEDDDFGDEYSDDDDTSWKVRRGATKLLSAAIHTRSDLLTTFYRNVSPALISRFGDREESVKVEIWGTYTNLLAQTKVWGSSPQASLDNGSGRLKRKRSADGMDTDEGPVSMLRSQAPTIGKSIIKQLNAKALATRQAGFALLHGLIDVLDGGLETQISSLVPRIEGALNASDVGLSGAATTLKIEVLSFVGLLVRTHHSKILSDDLPKITPLLTGAVGDKFNKIAAEAFVACADLVKALRPVVPSPAPVAAGTNPHLKAVFDATMKRLSSTDADEEVKGKGMICLGVLLFHAGDHLGADADAALTFLRDRLKNEVSRLIAVKVVAEVASSPVCGGSGFDQWVQECLVEVSTLLRKVNRQLKVAAFTCIAALLGRAGANVPPETSQALLADLQPLVSDSDVNLLPLALETIASILNHNPAASAQVQSSILPRVFDLVDSPLLQGPSLDSLLTFFQAFIRTGAEPSALIKVLDDSVDKVKLSQSTGGAQALATASRCIGVIVREAPATASASIKKYSATVKGAKTPAPALILALLTLGEIGRTNDLSKESATFTKVLEHFSATSEDVRRAAALSAGNITVGNPASFLPTILQLIQADDKKRYLALQALKEVIIHSPHELLASISDSLWTPLFDNCEAQEEGTRNVAADCLGQLTVTDPAKYLPQLQARLHSESRHTRATVIAAIRFTFTNDSSSYDELLAPLIAEFFKLIQDPDLGVRRLALTSLNSAAHNKPHLVRDQLSTLLPELYAQTVVDQSLVRIVEMGPFKHKVDDGLDIRKSAYECMRTLLDTCLKEIDIHEYLRRVLAGLTDEEDIKKLCYLMLLKLAQIAPTAVSQKLDDSVAPFTEVLQTTLKETAVKQETERLAELQKAALRCMVVLNRLASPTNTPKFSQCIATVVLTGKHAAEFKDLASQTSLTRVSDIQ
ncbi:TIP120-domain-containing protein [Meredithblackwellia eburnea MCA 4105]